MNINKTTVTPVSDIKHNWHLIDASQTTIGRVCTQIANLLMGKGKVNFSYHQDPGDYVVVINSDLVQYTGKKAKNKKYYSYTTNQPGSLKTFTLGEMLKKDSREVIIRSVSGMLPKNKLRDARLTRLKVFKDAKHSYSDKLSK